MCINISCFSVLSIKMLKTEKQEMYYLNYHNALWDCFWFHIAQIGNMVPNQVMLPDWALNPDWCYEHAPGFWTLKFYVWKTRHQMKWLCYAPCICINQGASEWGIYLPFPLTFPLSDYTTPRSSLYSICQYYRPFKIRAWSCITSYPLRGFPYLAYDNVNLAMVNSMMLHNSMHAFEKVFWVKLILNLLYCL